MANNAEVVLKFKVAEDGSLTLVTKNIDKASKATKGLAQNQQEASKAASEHNYKLNQGVTGVSSASRSFSKLSQTIGSGPNGLVGAYATLAANAFAVSAAFSALREAAQVEQMMKGLEEQGARTGRNLKGLSKDLQELTNYSISAAEAMQATALMSSAGFSSQGMKDLTAVANNAALALGRNVPDALDRISKGVTKLEPELLDELGIMTKLSEAQSAYALQNNKSVASLTSFEKRQAMLNAVVAEGTAKFGGLSDQVNANPYDQLAATFSDLTKNVLGFANSVLGPVAKIFGSSQGMLLGGVILFVSSIKKQLLPALFEMSKNSILAEQQHLAEAKAIKEKTAATLADAKAARSNALVSARGTTGTIAGAALPKKFKVEEIQKGTLSIKELNAELNRLTAAERAREASIKGEGFAINPAKLDLKKKELELLQAEIKNLKNIIDLETKGEADLTPLREAARKGRLSYLRASTLASMEGKKAQALEAASAGSLVDAWNSAKQAAAEYRRAVATQGKIERLQADGTIAKQGLMAKAGEVASGLMGSAGIFAQTAAAGFMKFLPYIGIATTALSGAWSVYKNFIQSDTEKAKIEAVQKLNETLENTAKNVKELNRLNSASVPIALKAAQTLTIQSNATREIADAFNAVKNARAEAESSNKTDSFWKALIGTDQDAASYLTGVSKGPALEAATKELANSTGTIAGAGIGAALGGFLLGSLGSSLGPVGTAAGIVLGVKLGEAAGEKVGTLMYKYLPAELNNVDEAALASIQAVDQLAKILDKDLYDSMEKAYGGAQKLYSSQVLRESFIQEAAKAYAGLADAVKELQDAFKNTGEAVTAFINNAIVKTSFDGLVEGFNGINKAFYNLDKSLAGSDLKKQFDLMVSMPEDLQRTLSAPNRVLIQQASTLSAELSNYKQLLQQAKDTEYESEELRKQAIQSAQKQVNAAEKRYEVLRSTANSIREEFEASEATVRVYQEQERVTKQRLTLHNAIKSSEQDLYALSAEGEKRRIEMENQAVRLQQLQLKAQIAMLDIYMAKQKAALAEFDIQLKILRAQQTITKEVANRSAREAAAGVTNYKATILQQATDEQSRKELEKSLEAIDKLVISKQASGANLFTDGTAVTISGRLLNDTERSYFLARQGQAVAEKTRDITESRAATQEQLTALEQSREALLNEVLALETQITDEQTAQAKIAEVRNKVAESIAAISREEKSLAVQNVNTQERINRLLLGRQELVIDTMLANFRENTNAVEKLKQEKAAAAQALKDQIAVISARKIDNDLKQASIKALEDQSAAEQKLFDQKVLQAELTREAAVLEALLQNGIEGTIQSLQEALKFYERRLELAQQVQNQELQIAQNASKIRILRAGGKVDEETQKQFEVEAAEAAYKQAIQTYQLRVHSIKLEYDLLDAQRQAQAENLKAQGYMIKAMWELMHPNKEMSDTLNSMVNNINTAAGAIERLDTSEMRRNAEREAANQVILARQNVEIAQAELANMQRGSRPGGAIANFVERIRSMSRVASDRTSTASGLPTDPIQLNFSKQQELLQQQLDAQKLTVEATQTIARAMTASNDNAPSVSTQPGRTAEQPQSSSNRQRMTMEETMSFAMRMAKDAGMAGSELGAQTGHKGAGHKEGRAIDVNIPGAGVEANDPKFKDRMDALARSYTEKGFVVLWNRLRYALDAQGKIITTTIPESWGPHIDHMHVEAQRAGVFMREGITDGGQQASKTMEAAIEGATPKAPKAAATPQLKAPTVTSMAQGFAPKEVPQEAPGDKIGESADKAVSKFDLLFGAIKAGMQESMDIMDELSSQMTERLGQDFGPQGKILQALNSAIRSIPLSFEQLKLGMDSIVSTMSNSTKTIATDTSAAAANVTTLAQQSGEAVTKSTEKAKSGFDTMMTGAKEAFSAISSIIGSIAAILKASSDAKIAGIDREIAAEQKRDGKSAESVAKIDAMEKKKDQIARKSFNTQKKLMMAQAVMSTAAGVAGALASSGTIGPIAAAIMAGVIGAMGMAQIAIISGMQYQSSYSPQAAASPSALSIGKRADSVDLARGPNANAGGEVGYLRGYAGTGANASNYRTVGSAYGGDLMRGYGNRGFVVGEKGPEVISPETPVNVTPANDINGGAPVNATINIQAIDSQGVQDVLVAQKGNIIQMLREAANSSGQRFLEDVNVNVYTRPNVGRL